MSSWIEKDETYYMPVARRQPIVITRGLGTTVWDENDVPMPAIVWWSERFWSSDVDEAEETLVWDGQKKGIRMVYRMLISNDDRMKWSEIKINQEK